jgi:hypothetical protein
MVGGPLDGRTCQMDGTVANFIDDRIPSRPMLVTYRLSATGDSATVISESTI